MTVPGWTNLLAAVDVSRGSLMSPWTLTDGVLRSPIDPGNEAEHQTLEFSIPNPSSNYDLRYRISRNSSGFGIILPFVRGDESPSVVADGGHGFGLRGIEDDPRSAWPGLVMDWGRRTGVFRKD